MSFNDWPRYYEAVQNLPPHRTLLDALGLIELTRASPAGKPAVDLGCGGGRDTFELLRRGWKVTAVDSESAALELIRANCPPDRSGLLQTVQSDFESMSLPECDLLNASLSLPFVRPERFDAVWEKVVTSIRPGGWFCGHLFGPRDGWAGRPDVTTHAEDEVRALFARFEIKSFAEKEEDGLTAFNRPKHWHRFSLVARKKNP